MALSGIGRRTTVLAGALIGAATLAGTALAHHGWSWAEA